MSNFTAALQPNAAEFNLHRRAFSSTEAEFFPNTGYLDAYIRLLDGICQHHGLLVLTGEAGTGKTLLLRKLIHEAPATIKFVFCYSTNLDFDNLLTIICDQLQIITHGWECPPKLKALKEYLNTCFEQGINVALLIDEAHHLGKDVLSQLLTLTQLGPKEGHILQIVLSGVPVLEEILVQQQALHPNIANAVHVRLEPLNEADVTAFIYRQLQSAGGPPPKNLLSVPVINGIVRYTGSIPRLINMLCERALWLAQLNGQSTVSTEIIDEAASELMLQERATVQELESWLSPIDSQEPHAIPPSLFATDQILVPEPQKLESPELPSKGREGSLKPKPVVSPRRDALPSKPRLLLSKLPWGISLAVFLVVTSVTLYVWQVSRQAAAKATSQRTEAAARQQATAEEARRQAEAASRQQAAAEEARQQAKAASRQRAAAEEARRQAEAASRQRAAAEEARRQAEAASRQRAAVKEAKQRQAKEIKRKAAEKVKRHAAARRAAEAAKLRQVKAGRQQPPQRSSASHAPTAPVDTAREIILSIFPREN